MLTGLSSSCRRSDCLLVSGRSRQKRVRLLRLQTSLWLAIVVALEEFLGVVEVADRTIVGFGFVIERVPLP